VIESIRGRLLAFQGDGLTIEVGGLGLFVQVPAGDRSRLAALSDGTPAAPPVHLFTHLVIRPESWQLFGFLEEEQRALFRLLLEVTGVGPRLALNVVSHLSLSQMREAVEAKETGSLVRVPGIGKRTAERILLELSGKLEKTLGEGAVLARVPAGQDAVDALVALGLAQPEALALVRAAARELGAEGEASALVAAALKRQRTPRGRS
jgi:Holliday junction DNA helicase RuvA